jgi:hypothetical protein
MEDVLAGNIADRCAVLDGLKQYFGFDAKGLIMLALFEKDGTKEKNKADYIHELKKSFSGTWADTSTYCFGKRGRARFCWCCRP